jgi:hypothetical protein
MSHIMMFAGWPTGWDGMRWDAVANIPRAISNCGIGALQIYAGTNYGKDSPHSRNQSNNGIELELLF